VAEWVGCGMHRLLAVLLPLACASCASFRYGATNGERSTGSWFPGGDSATQSLVHSAKNDIPCDDVTVLHDVDSGTDAGVYVVEGCGQRLAYAFVPQHDDVHARTCTLISRLSIQTR